MIIDLSYFRGEINIPNLNTPSGGSSMTEVVERTERELLLKVLGYELYDLLKANGTEQRFKDIIEGKAFEFTYNDRIVKRKWTGLRNIDKVSPIAYLAYYKYVVEHVTITTNIGEVVDFQENSQNVNPLVKLVNAYNKCVELIGTEIKPTRYHSFDTLKRHYNNEYQDSNPSLYSFLLTNKSIYPEWEFTGLNYINVFGF